MTQLAIITPSYINSQERAEFARQSFASIQSALYDKYLHIVVDDVPHLKGRIIHRITDFRFAGLANQVYRGNNVQVIRRHGRGSTSATLRAVQEARKAGCDLVFIHLDDCVYLPIMDELVQYALDAFDNEASLQMVRLTGLPILSKHCTAELGNRTLLNIHDDRVEFENLSLQPRRFDDYTLWWSAFHEKLMDDRYFAIPMWFTIFRTDFLEKLFTLDDKTIKQKTLGEVELYFKQNWREVLPHISGGLGYINMQFGGFETHRNENWETLIKLPNTPVR